MKAYTQKASNNPYCVRENTQYAMKDSLPTIKPSAP